MSLAVDNSLNIYTLNYTSTTLEKWLPGAEKPINLFEGRFQSSPIFYHLSSRSLYIFYVLNNKPSVYRLVDGSSIPMNVINVNGKGSELNQLGTSCAGLYVNSASHIFVLDYDNDRVVKWTLNATSGVLVANGSRDGSISYRTAGLVALCVDEINNALYVVDQSRRIVIKYTNDSVNGVIVFGGGPTTVFSDILSEYLQPISVLVDRMGNILVGEVNRITKWTPDRKSYVVVTSRDSQGVRFTEADISMPVIMTFDKFENLYVYDSQYQRGRVIKFTRNSTPCTNNLH
jgi:hypothetical protein